MSTQLQEAQQIAEKALERAKLFEALEANAEELKDLGVIVSGGEKPKAATAKKTAPAANARNFARKIIEDPQVTKSKRGRGRPKGSKNKAKDKAVAKKKGPKTKAATSTDIDTKIEAGDLDLPDLLTMIAQQVASPLRHPDFLKLVLASGYKQGMWKAKDKSNMVYQSLNKLVKRGTLKKDPDSREYSVADAA